LAWWVAGGSEDPTPRFPFRADDAKGFAEMFAVTQKAPGRSTKATAETCNIHMAWKALAPLILRRRKDETNEALVAKVYRSVRVPLGSAQATAYAAVIADPPLDARGVPAFMASLSRLRKAASIVPDCGHLLTPKLQAVLSILRNLLAEGEQVIVFSCFHDVLDAIGARLRSCGVPAHRADGRIGPEGCAKLAAQFRAKEFPILLCGDAMTDGHSFPDVANVVRVDRPWAHDKAAQAPDRAHRLNSSRDVTIWDVSTDHTIDVVIDSLLSDKSRTADLVLDGRLQARLQEEMTPAKLFRAAECVWETGDTVDETSLLSEWEAIAAGLRKTVASASMVSDWRRRLSC
jgi:SNF2 family DNA or RNA helicase